MKRNIIIICLTVNLALWVSVLGQEAFFRRSLVLAPEPEHCVVCSVKYHAPALLDLSTGELGEMEVYSPHPHPGGRDRRRTADRRLPHLGLRRVGAPRQRGGPGEHADPAQKQQDHGPGPVLPLLPGHAVSGPCRLGHPGRLWGAPGLAR